MKKLFVLVAAAIVAYVAATPYIEVWKIRSAANERDAERLAESVDFPSLRRNMKEQLRFTVLDGAADAATQNPLAAIGLAVGGVLLDGLVDLWVTPAGVMQMLKGDKPRADTSRSEPGESESDTREALRDADYHYTSWDRFVIEVPDGEVDVTKFVLRRHGFSWKLTNIILPVGD